MGQPLISSTVSYVCVFTWVRQQVLMGEFLMSLSTVRSAVTPSKEFQIRLTVLLACFSKVWVTYTCTIWGISAKDFGNQLGKYLIGTIFIHWLKHIRRLNTWILKIIMCTFSLLFVRKFLYRSKWKKIENPCTILFFCKSNYVSEF